MNDEIKKLLTDIFESILLIEKYTQHKLQFEIYSKDRQLKDSVERRLEIIGEAVNSLLEIDEKFPISNARKTDFKLYSQVQLSSESGFPEFI